MIDLQAQYIKDYLEGIDTRVSESAVAFSWLENQQTVNWSDILPNMTNVDDRTTNDLARYEEQITSLGPRAFSSKKNGVIGEVTWDVGTNQDLSEQLKALNVDRLAERLLRDFFVAGIAALYAFNDIDDGQDKLQKLGGYLEPLYKENDVSGEIVGLLQVRSSGGVDNKYNLRIYDFEDNVTREWQDKETAHEFGSRPDLEITTESKPVILITGHTEDGYARGPFLTSLGAVIGEYVQQMRVVRISESSTYSPTYFKGHWTAADKLGPHIAYRSNEEGWENAEIGKVDSGDMSNQFMVADKNLERVRAELDLPIHFTGTQPPSGVALEQLNISYATSIASDARDLSWIMTKGVQEYAALIGATNPEEVTVTVTPNREYVKEQTIESIISLNQSNLMPKSIAYKELQPYFNSWTDDELFELLEDDNTEANTSTLLEANNE